MPLWWNGRPACRQAGTHDSDMYYVYILQSIPKPTFTYKGLTDNLERRLTQHSKGKVKSTKLFLPFNLIHVELCETREEARTVEKMFKSGYGREIIKELLTI